MNRAPQSPSTAYELRILYLAIFWDLKRQEDAHWASARALRDTRKRMRVEMGAAIRKAQSCDK